MPHSCHHKPPTGLKPTGPRPHTCGATRRQILRNLAISPLVPLLGGLGVQGLLSGCDTKGPSFSVKGGERRPVMPASRYRDPRVRQIYGMARNHRDLLDKLFCYCYCNRAPVNHKSLLSCYTDDHGAG